MRVPAPQDAREEPLTSSPACGTNRLIGRIDLYVATSFARVVALALVSAYSIYALVELRALAHSRSVVEWAGFYVSSSTEVLEYQLWIGSDGFSVDLRPKSGAEPSTRMNGT